MKTYLFEIQMYRVLRIKAEDSEDIEDVRRDVMDRLQHGEWMESMIGTASVSNGVVVG